MKEKLNDLQLRVRQLIDQVEQIIKEQAYQRVGGHGALAPSAPQGTNLLDYSTWPCLKCVVFFSHEF